MDKPTGSARVTSAEMALIRGWLGRLTGSPAPDAPGHGRYSDRVPFRFLCGTRSSRDWLTLESADSESSNWDAGKRVHLLRWHDKATALACEMELTEFADFPALEWVVRLRNNGAHDTEPISAFAALDLVWKCPEAGQMPELRRSLGSDGRHDDFQDQRDALRQSRWGAARTLRMDSEQNNAFRQVRNGSCLPIDGRPSATWLPFFNLCTGDDGLIGAVGWGGQWFAEFAHDGESRTSISAGMEHLSARLHPGEAIRSPRMLLLYWQGEPNHAHNLLRRFLLEHHSPSVDGEPAQTPICNGSWGGTPTQRHLETVAAIADHGLPYDYYWIDAGWYGTSTKPCPNVFEGDWGITGDWRVNPNYHPHGLKPISDAVHAAGMKFLLWIEPERAKHGTPVTLEHPEWFLRSTDEEPKPNDNLLLDLGNPAAWQWAVDTISTLIEENGIDCYREDFNMDPSPYWRNADMEGRKGIAEVRFVEGFYAFWDELRRRHPHLLIDNCASGGRRLELETISRSVALWRTDYNCFPCMNPDASQLHGLGLNAWLPQHATSPFATPGDTYQARSAYSAGLVLNLEEFGMQDWRDPDFPWEWFRKRLEEARRLRPCFGGDFYALTPCVLDPAAWLAYQLFVPATGEGAVLAFRRSESRQTAATLQLRDLPEGVYEIEDADSSETWRETSEDLRTQGLAISLPEPRSSRLVFYRRLSPTSPHLPNPTDPTDPTDSQGAQDR